MKIGKIIWGGFAFVGIVTSLILISIVIFYFILIRTPENNEKDKFNRTLLDEFIVYFFPKQHIEKYSLTTSEVL